MARAPVFFDQPNYNLLITHKQRIHWLSSPLTLICVFGTYFPPPLPRSRPGLEHPLIQMNPSNRSLWAEHGY